MSNGISGLGAPTVVARATPSGTTTAASTTPNPLAGTYQTDSYAGPATSGSIPLHVIANDYRRPVDYTALRIQQKLGGLGIHNTQDLLSRANTPTKRSMLAAALSAFDGSITKAQATQYLQSWIGLADLARTGMPLDGARLLQASNIHDTYSLSRYWTEMDKLALYTHMTSIAMQVGYAAPPWEPFSQAVDAARSLPPAVRW